MKISQFPINNIIFNNAIPKRQVNFGLASDVFERTTKDTPAVSWFKSQTYGSLKNILNNRANEIGRGYFHIAYNIPKEKDLVIRTKRSFNINQHQNSDISIKDTEDKSLKINIGQSLASIIFTNRNSKKQQEIEILRKQNGEPVGVKPYEIVRKKMSIEEYSSKEMKEKYAKSLQALADFPVAAYEKLIDTLQEASKCNYCFDYINSNNLLYDTKTKSINVIDLEKGSGILNYGSILYALTNTSYAKVYNNIGYEVPMEEMEKTVANSEKVMQNFIKALENKGLAEEAEDCMLCYFGMMMGALLSQDIL